MAEIIQGFAEFEENLRKLERVYQKKVLLKVAKAGAAIVLEAAKKLAPRRSGRLAENMTMVARTGAADINEASVDVGPEKSQFYGYFQEKGTVHQRSQPFLEPALEQSREAATDAMTEVFLAQLEPFQ